MGINTLEKGVDSGAVKSVVHIELLRLRKIMVRLLKDVLIPIEQ